MFTGFTTLEREDFIRYDSFSVELLQMKDAITHFIEYEVEPHATDIKEGDNVPEWLLNKSRELGLFGLSIPKEYGGMGLNMVEKSALFEELGKTINGYTTCSRCP